MANEYELDIADRIVITVRGVFTILACLVVAACIWPIHALYGVFKKKEHEPVMRRVMRGWYDRFEIEEAFDDAIDEWHTGSSKLELHEYLGLTWEEYKRWGENPRSIFDIIHEREENGQGEF